MSGEGGRNARKGFTECPGKAGQETEASVIGERQHNYSVTKAKNQETYFYSQPCAQ